MSRFLQLWHGRLLTLVALLVSSFGGLRASIADPMDDLADHGGVVIDRAMDVALPAAPQPAIEQVQVSIGSDTAPVPSVGSVPPIVTEPPIVAEPPALRAPGPRLGSARGPRAP